MWQTLFLIGAWITITPPESLITPTTDVMLLEFSKPLSTVGLFATSNYTIVDENNVNIPILDIEVVDTLDGDVIPQTTLIALIIPKQDCRKILTITVRNLRSLEGLALNVEHNSDSYFHNRYLPNLEQSPKLIIKN